MSSVNIHHDGIFVADPLRYIQGDMKQLTNYRFDGMYSVPLNIGITELRTDDNVKEFLTCSDISDEYDSSEEDGDPDYVDFQTEGEENIVIPNVTTTYLFLNELCSNNGYFRGFDESSIVDRFKIKKGVSYPKFNPSLEWNKMEHVLGMRFDHPEQLRLMLANYYVANGYQLWLGSLAILDTNPGSTCRLDVEETDDDNTYFKRFYVCFRGVKDGWIEGCRKIIGLDGWFLKHTCRGELLTTMGRDANNQMYPIAWAVVKVENKDNCLWFLGLLHDDLNLQHGCGLIVILDSHKEEFKFIGDKLVSWSLKKQGYTAMLTDKAKTKYQLADLFTEVLPNEMFEYLVHRIGMQCMTPTELDRLVKCKYVTRSMGKGRKNEENMDSYETLRCNPYDSVTPGFMIIGMIRQTKDIYSDNIMDGINIDDHTIERYLRLTHENQTPSMSFKEELSSEEDLNEWLKAEMEKHMSKQNEKNKEDALIAIIKSIREECRVVHKNKQISALEGADLKKSSKTMEDTINNDSFSNASNNAIPRSIYEYQKLANLGGATMSVEMDDMKQQETLGTVKNVLVKTDKFEFLCDLVVIDMPENLEKMIILGRPFLETIHAQIDVFQEEISLGIGKDRIKFDVNGNPRRPNITIEKIYMANTSQEEESFNPFEIGHDLFLYESPACLQFEHDTKNYDTIDPCFMMTKVVKIVECGLLTTLTQVYAMVIKRFLENVNRECLDNNFDVEEEYAKEIGNPYTRRFDEYKRVFDNEVENFSNEYTLRVGKKGYNLDDVWEICEQYHKNVIDSWHDIGYEEEEELWRSGDEKTDY
ncbi:splicing factor [Tanacetum coccineum]